MAKAFEAQLSTLRFPRTCVVCLSSSSTEYERDKVFSYGRRSYTVKLPIPMCTQHFEAASFKGAAERLVDRLGLIVGGFAGLFATIILFLRWEGGGEGNLLLNLFAGGVFGLGVFIMIWAVIAMWLAPLFAEPESKEARNAVRITHYWPNDQMLRLEFENEQLAEMIHRQIDLIDPIG